MPNKTELALLTYRVDDLPPIGPLLMSTTHPTGHKLEDVLGTLINEMVDKTRRIARDQRPQAGIVIDNNFMILAMLTRARQTLLDSMAVLAEMRPDEGPLGTPRLGA